MDRKIKKTERAIMSILEEYSKIKYDNVDGQNYVIADKENHRYQVVTIGWQGRRFIHDCPIHMDIINGKVWIFQNNTEWDLGSMLEEQGVPKSDVVLGFFSESMRSYTEYAIG
jgi:XisI protein